MKKLHLIIGTSLIAAGIAFSQFSVDSQGNVSGIKSINLIPSCNGFLFNSGGNISCQTIPSGGGSGIGPSVSATNDDGQTFAYGVNILTFPENVWDTGNFHSTVTNPTRFYAQSTGYYLATTTMMITSGGVSFQLFYRINGADIVGSGVGQATASNNLTTGGSFSLMVHMNAGDYIEAYTFASGQMTSVPYYDTMQLTKLASIF